MKRVLPLFTLLTIGYTSYSQAIYDRTLKLMGSRFDITVVADDQSQADLYIDLAVAEISRIEKLISSWDQSSQTSEVNRNAGVQPVVVDQELYQLIQRAIKISELSDGAFDISYASIDRIWKFDGSVTTAPSQEVIAQSVKNIGYKNILLNPVKGTVFLKNEGMKIGFGAIGKGYAADMAKALLINQGVDAGIINASGDMNTWGTKPDGSPWLVAITNPFDKTKPYASLPIKQGAVVTSGNYEKFIMIGDIRYAHIIDPRTGWPTQGILSATVFAPKAELADALATAIFVMGIDAGLNRINQLPQIECIIVDLNGGLHTSSQIKITTP